MRIFSAFLFTPFIACFFAVLFMQAIELNTFRVQDDQFIFLFFTLSTAMFMSLFVYTFEIILFLPLYVYLSKNNSISKLSIIVSAVATSLIAGIAVSFLIHNAINLQFIAFSGVVGLFSGLVFYFIHEKHKMKYFFLFSILFTAITIGFLGLLGFFDTSKKQHLEEFRFGNDESISEYFFDSAGKKIIVSPSNIYSNNGLNVTDSIDIGYPDELNVNYFWVHLKYWKIRHKYKDKESYYFKEYTDASIYKSNSLNIDGLDKRVTWYPKDNNRYPEDYYIIDGDQQYDHVVVHRTKIIATVCRVRTSLNENLQISFSFRTKNNAEDDLRLINKVIEEISLRVKNIKGK